MSQSGSTKPPIYLELRGLEVFFNQREPAQASGSSTEQHFHLRIDSLRVNGGEMVGVAGRSGEGKSTLLHVLALLLRPPVLERLEYHYLVDGQPRSFDVARTDQEVSDSDLEKLRNEAFGFIFQQHFLLPYFDVRENVSLPLMVRPGYQAGSLDGPIDRLLERLGLDEGHRKKRPSQLSGGQNQRVAVARALLHEPPFLFADEPTANLDRHKREQVLQHLRATADSGRCVVLVSHELGDLAHYCDRILMVQDNRLVDAFGPSAGSPDAIPLPPIQKQNGRSLTRPRDDAAEITSHLGELIWPVGSPPEDGPPSRPTTLAAPPPVDPRSRNDGRLGFRGHAWKYARNEVFSKKQMLIRILVATLLVAATFSFSFLSDLGRGSLNYLTEATLNKPSEYLNRFIVRRKDPVNRLKPEHVRFLAQKVPGIKAPPTFRQKEYRYQVYTQSGMREDKHGPHSVPDGDDTLVPVKPEDREMAQMGVIYLKGGPFPLGQTDRAGVIVSRRFLRQTYWRTEGQTNAPDGEYPDFLELRLPVGDGGCDEEDAPERYLPGINGRIKVPVVGVFEYPTLVVKNTTNGELALPQVYFPEKFLRLFGTRDEKPRWAWYYPFLIERVGDRGKPVRVIEPYDVIASVALEITGGARSGNWLAAELSDERSELYRALKRPFGSSLVPTLENGKILLRFDKAREQGRQKLTRKKFEDILGQDIREAVQQASQGGDVRIDRVEMRSVSSLFPRAEIPPFPEDQPVYVDAIVRLKSFRDVLPARRAVESALGEEVEIEPKGGQVVALERFESISDFMKYGYIAMQITYVVSLMFIIGITAYMHVTSKIGDIGILRSYGLSPRSIAGVYALELAMMMIPACLIGIVAAGVLARFSNDLVAEKIVMSAGSRDEQAPPDPTASKPVVFSSLQLGPAGNLLETGKTLALVGSILALVTGMSVWLIKRQQIVDSLRSGAS